MNKLFEYQHEYCSSINNGYLPGYTEDRKDVGLKDIYAPLILKNLDTIDFHTLQEAAILATKGRAEGSIYAESKANTVLLYGAAGGGKSTYMKRLTLAIFDHSPADWDVIADLPDEMKKLLFVDLSMPLYVDLNTFKGNIPKVSSFLEMIFLALCEMYPKQFRDDVSFENFRMWFDEIAVGGQLCLMLDHICPSGFDLKLVTDTIEYLHEKDHGNVVISAARTTDVREFDLHRLFADQYRVDFNMNGKKTLIHNLKLYDLANGNIRSHSLSSWVTEDFYEDLCPWSDLAQTPLGLTKLYSMTKNNSGMLPQNRTAFLEAMAENCVLGLADKNIETAVRLVIEQMAWSLEEKDEFETEEFDAFVAMVLDDYKDQIEGSPDELKDSLKRYCRLTGLISPFISFNTGRLCYVFNSSEMKDYLAASGICRWFEMQKEVIYLKFVRGFYPDARKSNVLSFILTLANPKIRAEIHKDIANGEVAKWREAPFNLTMHRKTICGIDYGYAYQKNFFLSPEQELEGKQAELTEEENKDEEF